MLNITILQGRFARDPSLKTTPQGNNVLLFPLACDKFTNGNKSTDWFDCIAWNKTAEFINTHFKKGDTIIVVGRLQTRVYDSRSGEKHKVCEIVVDKCEFAGGKKEGEEAAEQEPAKDPEALELPFEI